MSNGSTTINVDAANYTIFQQVQSTISAGATEVAGLRRKLGITYWLIIVLSGLMFLMGIILISVPAIAAFRGQITELQSLVAAGFGIADLAALFLGRPIERIHRIMGDMSQLVVALNCFQSQLSLRLWAMDSRDRSSINSAANVIGEDGAKCLELIQTYFELPEAQEPTVNRSPEELVTPNN